MRRELDRVPRRLRATVHRDLQPPGRGLDEELRGATTLLDRKQKALAGRPERKEPVHAPVGQKVDVRADRSLVECLPGVPERRQSRGKRASQHASNSKLNPAWAGCESNGTATSCE